MNSFLYIIIECEYQQYFLPGDGAGHVGKRRRKEDTPEPEEADFKPFVPKKQTRKVERKLIPMIMKINPADLNESGIASRFNEIVDKIFEENNWINFRFFENKDSEFWKTNHHNYIQVRASTKAIASHSQMEVSEYLSMGKRSWMLFSKWKPLGDPDLCVQEGRMIHYAIRNGKPEDFKDMSEAQLLLACQRENPFWYKLHPSPDLRVSSRTPLCGSAWFQASVAAKYNKHNIA